MQVGVLEKFRVKTKKPTKADRINKLVSRCQQGDQAAFRELFDESVSGVYRHLSLLIGPGPDIDDLVQLVFLNIFNSIKRFRGKSAFSTWLFRITVNVARQEIRVRGRRRRIDKAVNEVGKVHSFATDTTPEQKLLISQQIYDILDYLPIKKRETFILYTYEGYSLEEIASLLESSVSTIGSRLQSARKEIMKVLAHRRIK
ncbi:MAG: RNA polymerase sigma factor [Proteobacteria bacterium]|nr:RNA polymerase sigma factor [Pseudomonadota bacterium]